MRRPNHLQTVVADAFDASVVQQMRDTLGDATLSRLMECFADDVGKAEAELDQRHAQSDVNGLMWAARNLRGTAGQYGARDLARAASMLDDLCVANNKDDLQAKVRLVRSLCRQAIIETFKYRSL